MSDTNVGGGLPIPSLPEQANNGQNAVPYFADTVDTLVALYDYQGAVPTDLSFKAGDVVKVLFRQPDGWWTVKRIRDDAVGVVPSNFFVSESHPCAGYIFLIFGLL